MQRTLWIVLADHLASALESSCPSAQPGEPSPQAAVRQGGPSLSQGMVLPVVIHQGPVLVSDCFPIGLFGPQELLRFVDQRIADKLLVA